MECLFPNKRLENDKERNLAAEQKRLCLCLWTGAASAVTLKEFSGRFKILYICRLLDHFPIVSAE
jgi:hypothetical protein